MTSLKTPMRQDVLIGGKYRLGPIIGTGGIATVRRATHLWTEREVAVKLLDPTLPYFEQLRAGFLREARTTVQLDHPNVVDVLDMGEDGWDTAYLVMELLDGPTLRDVLFERGKLGEEETLAILLPLLDALEKAHDLGIIHRDFKPDNIMLTPNAHGGVTPKLLDFGVAEILQDAHLRSLSASGGVIMGTPQYMSPEQARDERALIGPHTDVWGVGVVWYECLTGHPPFDGERPEDVLHAVCKAPIRFDELPDRYVPLLRAALERSPNRRIPSIADLKSRMEQLGLAPARAEEPRPGSSTPAPAEPGPTWRTADPEVIRLPKRSNASVWLAGVGLALAVVLAAWWSLREPPPGTTTTTNVADRAPAPVPSVEADPPVLDALAPEADPPVLEAAEPEAEAPEPDAVPTIAATVQTPTESVADEPPLEATPEPPATKTRRSKPTRATPPSPPPEAPAPDDSRYRKPPDLVTEW